MRVVVVNYGGDFSATSNPEEALDGLRALTTWCEAVAEAGADLTVLQGFVRDARLRRNGVDYHMVAGPFSPALSRRHIPRRLHRIVAGLEPDLVHVNGLLYGLQTRAQRVALPRHCRLVLQHHAERPDTGLAGWIQRWGLRAADAFFFASNELAESWRQQGLIRSHQQVFEIMEGSTHFCPGDRLEARATTGMTGNPVCLWAANLDANKDPLTVLAGFERFLEQKPEARLYMAYRFDSLLPDVHKGLADSPKLSAAVELLGPQPYDRMEAIFNSADYFLQGSYREGSGYALADAMACGVIPVVTNIASFRTMTEDGSVGALWHPGDAASLHDALSRIVQKNIESQRRRARQIFDTQLSLEVIASRVLAAYREVLNQPDR